MATRHTATDLNPRGWRRKWRRARPDERRTAAGALADVFERRRGRWGFFWLLVLVSAAAHAAVTPLMTSAKSTSVLEVARKGYLQRVLQTERAKRVSRQIRGRITMPPPPPVPEAVVSETLSRELASDIVKVVGNLLTADVTRGLTDHVQANLADELAQAARDIADGNLSEAEIRQLQDDMKRRAHELAVQALKVHRVKTQVKRAQISVTRWYEKDVADTLTKNIYYETFLLPHKGAVWHNAYAGMYFGQRGKVCNWSQARSLDYLRKKISSLNALAAGNKPKVWPAEKITGWPQPGAEPAEILDRRLRQLYAGEGPSWRALVHGGADKYKAGTKHRYQHRTDGLLKEYYPHRREEMAKLAEAASAQWAKALAASAAYLEEARAGSAEARLKAAHDACVGGIQRLVEAMRRLQQAEAKTYQAVNALVRSQVLRGPDRERVYARLVDKLVAGLGPLVKEFAIGQFEEGIIKWDKTAEEAMDEFPRMILPLLRRDMKRLFPKKRFDKLVFHADYPDRSYKSPVTGKRRGWPSGEQARADDRELARLLGGRADLKAYAGQRREVLTRHFEKAIGRVVEEILSRVLAQGLMFRDLAAFVEGVDFQDKVREKLDARKRAMEGRGQDLARLTKDGVPDTAAAQYALLWGGSKGHGANLVPVLTSMRPEFFGGVRTHALRGSAPSYPPPAAEWGFQRQVPAGQVLPKFKKPMLRFEAIPFLPRFPALDGKLGDLARLRPLVLKSHPARDPILVYAGWNYQGYFFYYEVKQPAEQFYYTVPSIRSMVARRRPQQRPKDVRWAYAGDSCRICFDTLNARNPNRGEPHTQELVLLPRGTDTNPYHPGIERVIASQRDAVTKEYRGVKSSCKEFPTQPMAQYGPDGSGPYRVTRFGQEGYSVEIFIPRSLFKVPVFAPGWYVGFDVSVAQGSQGSGRRFRGQHWARGAADNPDQWGDLLLLGTDPRITIQEAAGGYPLADSLVPGRSYLLTVADPDRNVYLTAEDTVLVSVEVRGAARPAGRQAGNDVEVFILTETGRNTGVFRGFVNTQPGAGRRVQGALEILPGDEAGFGYVDTANARGQRNVIYEMKLPVAAAVMQVVAGK